jgi:hypothetical protein
MLSSCGVGVDVLCNVAQIYCTPTPVLSRSTVTVLAAIISADTQIHPKFHYAKRRFSITSKCRHIYGVLNVDEIKN